MFSDVFVPIIPVLVATGLFMGLRGLLTQEAVLSVFGMTPEDIPSSLLTFTQILTDTAFSFLPALVCWSTFRNFGGSPVIGIVLGLMLVSPSLPSSYDVGSGAADPLVFLDLSKWQAIRDLSFLRSLQVLSRQNLKNGSVNMFRMLLI